MAQIICIIGNKGGTGKTTVSHMLGHGLSLLGKRAVVVLTDPSRQPLCKDGRRYSTVDARAGSQLVRVMEKLRGLKEWLGVIDGGGNRSDMDRHLYSLADLVLLPFRDSHEDMRTVLTDLEQFGNGYLLPSQWPFNPLQLQSATRSVDDLLGRQRGRMLQPVTAISASKLLLQDRVPDALPSNLNRACLNLARQVLECLHLEVPSMGDDQQELAAPESMAG
jgi:ABC-type glutathione transport system ATPase component